MDQPCFLQHGHRIKQLTGEDFNQLSTQADELVLLDELVKVGREQLEY